MGLSLGMAVSVGSSHLDLQDQTIPHAFRTRRPWLNPCAGGGNMADCLAPRIERSTDYPLAWPGSLPVRVGKRFSYLFCRLTDLFFFFKASLPTSFLAQCLHHMFPRRSPYLTLRSTKSYTGFEVSACFVLFVCRICPEGDKVVHSLATKHLE